MTCASCVNRIERFLRKTPGVETATVNLATEMATIRYLPDVADRAALVGAIESAGYDVRTSPPAERTRRRRRSPTSCGADDLERARAARAAAGPGGRSRSRSPRDHGRHVRAPDRRSAMDELNRLVADPGDVHPGLGRRPLLPGGLARRAARHDQHGHARRGRHDRGLGLQRGRHPLAGGRRRGGRRARHLLRFLDDHHRPRPARPLAGGAGQGTDDRRDPPARRAQPDDRPARRATAATARSRSRPSRPATCSASGRATRSRSTGSSSRAARRSTRRC